MDYSVYNDYELLYLIHDGCEPALNLLHKKYSHLIYSIAKRYYPYGDKIYDLIQEGRIVLQECIFGYNPERDATFYSYFLICYKRRIVKLINSDYYLEFEHLEDNIVDGIDYSSWYYSSNVFKDEEDQRLYKEVLIDGLKLRQYAKIHNQSYTSVYRRYEQIIEKIRKWVS